MRSGRAIVIGALATTFATGFAAPSFAGEPYCGAYCVYSALRIVGKSPRLIDLLDKRYITSELGGSANDLVRMIHDFEGHAGFVYGLGSGSLKSARNPIILHVRRSGYQAPFNHWVLFLGFEGDKARILDAPGESSVMPLAELLSIWDGVGVVVSNKRIGDWSLRFGQWMHVGSILLPAILALIFIVRASQKRDRWIGRPWLQANGILLASLALAVAYHAGSPEGFLRGESAVGDVKRRHFEKSFPEVTAEDLAMLVGRRDVTVIDCRLPSDYSVGRIPGAINLPVTATAKERDRILIGLPRHRRVVFYCSNSSCTWSDRVASDLYFQGYESVSIFSAGWHGWRNRESGNNHSAQ